MKSIFKLVLVLVLLMAGVYCCRKTTAREELPPAVLTDYDGNVYKTIRIGSQTWMAENLKVTHYNNGDPVLEIKDNQMWRSSITGAHTVYDNLSWKAKEYGLLYNWHAVTDPRGICPKGWHVPTDQEWSDLQHHLEKGTAGTGSKPVRTDSGFNPLPGGVRNTVGTFFYQRENGYFWTSTLQDQNSAYCRVFSMNDKQFQRTTAFLNEGMSIRLVKDH